MSKPKTCNECKYAYYQDYGYSNYTVEGTEFACLKQVHPDGEFDRFYGENPKLEKAADCQEFLKGDPLHIDVEMEVGGIDAYTDDPDVIDLYNDYVGVERGNA